MSDGHIPVLKAKKRDEPERAAARPLDPLFAATLVNQIAPQEPTPTQSYPRKRGPRPGIAFDIKT